MKYEEVTEALRALAARDAGREAPARVKAALLEAFDRRHPTKRRARWLWAAAAAVVILIGMSLFWRPQPRIQPPVGRPFQAAAGLPPGAPAASPPAVAHKRPALRRVRRPAPRPREVATQYIPLGYDSGVPEDGPVPVLRMQLPRAVLVSFGLPMSPDLETETVDADVVLDNAGMARAIRFVR